MSVGGYILRFLGHEVQLNFLKLSQHSLSVLLKRQLAHLKYAQLKEGILEELLCKHHRTLR